MKLTDEQIYDTVRPILDPLGKELGVHLPFEKIAEAARAIEAEVLRLNGIDGAVEAVEMSPEFTDTSRAALCWVLWHHQGASSEIGQAMRFALGMGRTERLNEHQVAQAKRWATLAPPQQQQAAPVPDGLLEALSPFERLFAEADKMNAVGRINLDCQISVADLRRLAYAAYDLRFAMLSAAPKVG